MHEVDPCWVFLARDLLGQTIFQRHWPWPGTHSFRQELFNEISSSLGGMDTNVSFFSIGLGVNGPNAGIASNEDLVRILPAP